MYIRTTFLWISLLTLTIISFKTWGWQGIALVAGALVFWQLLHFTQMMQVLKRAANRPKGYVDSAIMLHVKLKKGMKLLDILARTRSLGVQISEKPEVWRWTDASGCSVECELQLGKLMRFELIRL
jgi:hypothetical protein